MGGPSPYMRLCEKGMKLVEFMLTTSLRSASCLIEMEASVVEVDEAFQVPSNNRTGSLQRVARGMRGKPASVRPVP